MWTHDLALREIAVAIFRECRLSTLPDMAFPLALLDGGVSQSALLGGKAAWRPHGWARIPRFPSMIYCELEPTAIE